MIKVLGKIKLTNRAVVMDPCYDLKTDIGYGVKLDNVKPGEYFVGVELWDNVIRSLEVTHVDHCRENESDLVDDFENIGLVCVDSGQAGIFDYDYFDKVSDPKIFDSWYDEVCGLTSKKEAGTKDDGCAVSSTGVGDGEFNVMVGYSKGQVVYINIDFYDDEEDDYDYEEDEDDYDWYDSYEEENELSESSKVKMKKYYVVYTDYNSEEFNIHGVCTRKSEGTKLFIKTLKDFFFTGPDDITYLRLIEVELEPEEVEFLKLNDGSDKIHELLDDKIWSRYCEELFVEGCDTIWTEIIPAYCLDRDLDPENDEDYEAAQEILFDNDEAFSDYIDYYIEENYK